MHHRPINPKAAPEARGLLEKLYALRGRKTLSAQHDYISSGTRYNDQIADIMGRAPSIFGGDFSFCYRGEKPAKIQHCGPANLTEPGHGIAQWERKPSKGFDPETEPEFREIDLHEERLALVGRCIRKHKAGHFITLMWHGPVPNCGDTSGDHDLWAQGAFSEAQWQAMLTEGTELHQAWLAQVDRIAGYLRLLAEAGVPVLWRPYHEMNGGWFWWGQRRGPGYEFARLWEMLYQRYTDHHQLHNLLWVWNPNAPRETPGDEAEAYAAYFPGVDQVDALATDVYHNDYQESHYLDLIQLASEKIIALGEVGHLPTPGLLDQQPLWSWVMPWGGLVFRFNDDQTISKLGQRLD